MMGINMLFIIPFVFLQTVFGQGGEQRIEFSVAENPKTYIEDNQVAVTCKVSPASSNIDTMTWYKMDGTRVIDTITNQKQNVFPYVRSFPPSMLLLALGKASDENAGHYKCEATLKNGPPFSDTFIVKVQARLRIQNCPEKQFGVLNMPSTIKCSASTNGQSNGTLTMWSKSNSDIDIENDPAYTLHATKIYIQKTEMSNKGQYMYSAFSNSNGQNVMQMIDFEVYSAPEIIEPITQTASEAAVGKPAVMFCKANGIPDPIIEWTKKGSTNILQTGDRIQIKSNKEGGLIQGILNITNVIKEDESEYTCTAKNEASNLQLAETSSRTAQLTVLVPPTIERANNGSGRENAPVSLVCVARGDPIPKMIWINERTQERYVTGATADGVSAVQENDNDPGNPGATLTLSFTSLAHTNAGLYKCEAANKAATVSKSVFLDVEYKPNFKDQGSSTFYNWEGNNEPFVVCTANSNPAPSFRWMKGTDQEISSTDPYYDIKPSVKDPEHKHRYVSKLEVDIKSIGDKDALFGQYTCIATNLVGPSQQTLTMEKAASPGKPIVDIRFDDASFIEFWLEGPNVKGPEVERYRLSYKIKGSNSNSTVMEVEREYRDHIDSSRKYTIIRVEGLKPNTLYVFDFYARNAVGEGPATNLEHLTKKVRKPDAPRLDDTPMNSGKPTEILVKWTIPSNGGSIITEYRLSYQRVNVKANTSDNTPYQVEAKIGKPVTRAGIKDPTYLIEGLLPGSYYEIKVSAVNREGSGLQATKVVKTQIAESVPGASTDENYDPSISGTGSRWEPVHVSMTMLGCLITLHACLKRLM